MLGSTAAGCSTACGWRAALAVALLTDMEQQQQHATQCAPAYLRRAVLTVLACALQVGNVGLIFTKGDLNEVRITLTVTWLAGTAA